MKATTMLEIILYRIFWYLMTPFLWPFVFIRTLQHKEDETSRKDRFAHREIAAKTGARIWLHAASVGESLISINIANHLREIRPDLQFLFTCQTQTGAQIIQKQLTKNDIFRFAPFDHPFIGARFVQKATVDLAVFIEGEIWPNLLHELRKNNIKTALINSRMTNKSISNWLGSKGLGQMAFSGFDFAQAANAPTHEFLSGFRIHLSPIINNLKYAAPPLVFDQFELENLKAKIGNRKIFLAASTHEGEEEIIFSAFKSILEKHENTLLIIAPRHVKRSAAINEIASNYGFECAFRSQNQIPNIKQRVFVWDVLGQMGLFYKLADFAFIAGSLLPKIGGHNPIEPAQLDCAIITGPYFHNFTDVFADLKSRNAMIETGADAETISNAVLKIFDTSTNIEDMKTNAQNFVAQSKHLLSEIDDNLLQLLGDK